MTDDVLARQLLVKLLAAMEDIARLLHEGESREAVADALDKAATELRDALHRGYV